MNFDSRVECKRCGFIEVKERMNKLKNFDKMFDSWTESYNKWKVSNQDNPDKDYVANYTAQMEAMRHQLLDKRKVIQDGDPLLKPKPKASFGKRVLEDEVMEQRVQQVKRSRWEQDMDLDIESWRRPKQSEEDFWKPKAVKDYSQQGLPRRSKQEFRPSETFDQSQKGCSECVSTRSVFSLKKCSLKNLDLNRYLSVTQNTLDWLRQTSSMWRINSTSRVRMVRAARKRMMRSLQTMKMRRRRILSQLMMKMSRVKRR